MEKESKSKRELLTRVLMILGGAMALIFGLLTAFIPGLAYVEVWVFSPFITTPAVVHFSFDFQIHGFTFGLLVSSVGGLLGLTAALTPVNRRAYLGFMGDFLGILGFFLGILGFLFYPPSSYVTIPEFHFFDVPWVGVCLTLAGVSVMFIGSMVKSEGWHRLTLLGIPLLLTSWLTYPLLIAINNRPLLLSIYRSGLMNALFFYFFIIGFVLTLLGSAIGFWKSSAHLRQKLAYI